MRAGKGKNHILAHGRINAEEAAWLTGVDPSPTPRRQGDIDSLPTPLTDRLSPVVVKPGFESSSFCGRRCPMSSPTVHSPPKVEQSDNVRVITFSTEGVRDVENMLARDLEGCTDELGGCHLLLDFTNVARLGSVELGTLVELHKRMKACGGRLTLFNLNADIYEVFTVTNLQTLLGICRDRRTPPDGGYTTAVKNETDGAGETKTAYSGDPDKYVYCE
jgi:anti-anti-sigma factor